MSSGVPFDVHITWCGVTFHVKGRYYRGSPAIYNPPDRAQPEDPDEYDIEKILTPEGDRLNLWKSVEDPLRQQLIDDEDGTFFQAISDEFHDYPDEDPRY